MSNEFKGIEAHSAEWFGDQRDYWWNEDYLRFVAARWRADRVFSVLDVGCGVGHWARLLSRVLPKTCRITGVDRESQWIQAAAAQAAMSGLHDRLQFQIGTAENLPFNDGTFDLVTCQTVLMHLRHPERGLAEMVRVARPGGLIMVAEPTNVLGPALLDALALAEPPEMTAALLRFQLQCQRGKAALGEGNDFIGESLPVLFASANLEEIEMRMNDRVNLMLAPYATSAARAISDQTRELADRRLWMWNRETTLRYFVAGGGREFEFDANWEVVLAFLRRVAHAMSVGRYASAGGGLHYLIWGRKPGAVNLSSTSINPQIT